MPIRVVVTRDFEHMSEVAAHVVLQNIKRTLKQKTEFVLGLATGSSPTGMYKHLAKAANDGVFDSGRLRSFNLDEYVGLPGKNAQQRVLHPESYSFFMIQELFGLLSNKFIETNLPGGCLIDQKKLISELRANPDDWRELGADAGKSIAIRAKANSQYLAWVRKVILNGYTQKIRKAGGIDLQVIGVGGRGHVAFHESGIPLKNSKMLLVKLDDNTIANALADGHFSSTRDCPRYAISMGAELVYQARTVVLLASGARKTAPVAASLLNEPTDEVPISYGQQYATGDGELIYIVDRIAAKQLIADLPLLKKKGIKVEDRSKEKAKRRLKSVTFSLDPKAGQFC